MSQYFYDSQVRRYLTQFMRLMSNFSYKDAKGQLVQVPVRYGDMNKQVANIINKNSENTIPSAPFIACYIKDIKFDRDRIQDPTFVSKINIRERDYDEENNTYLNTQGKNYTVERLMPNPYTVSFVSDIWTTNIDQKLQIWEQLTILFNPSFELQTTDNYIDWTSLTVLELDNMTFESRAIPQGATSDISICSMSFKSPIWISPPVKVKKLGIITKIISNVFTDAPGAISNGDYNNLNADIFAGREPDITAVVTPGNYDLLVLNNIANIIPAKQSALENSNDYKNTAIKDNWYKILDLYPGKFKAGISQIRLKKPNGNEIVAYISLNPIDDLSMTLNIDADTIPENTLISDLTNTNVRGTIDAIIDPQKYNPKIPAIDTRYLILEDINSNIALSGYSGPIAWKNANGSDFVANANDIIQWDGTQWNVIFDAQSSNEVTYVRNSFTGIQYKWQDGQWSKSYEGIYEAGAWRLIL
jgi:hypothetical protein